MFLARSLATFNSFPESLCILIILAITVSETKVQTRKIYLKIQDLAFSRI